MTEQQKLFCYMKKCQCCRQTDKLKSLALMQNSQHQSFHQMDRHKSLAPMQNSQCQSYHQTDKHKSLALTQNSQCQSYRQTDKHKSLALTQNSNRGRWKQSLREVTPFILFGVMLFSWSRCSTEQTWRQQVACKLICVLCFRNMTIWTDFQYSHWQCRFCWEML